MNNRQFLGTIAPLFLVVLPVGCTSVNGVRRAADPPQITLVQGVEQVITALDKFASVEVPDQASGLVAAEIVVEFAVEAGQVKSGDGSVELKIGEGIGASVSAAEETKASATNTITLTFRNILFANKDELVSSKTPEELLQLLQELRTKEGHQQWRLVR